MAEAGTIIIGAGPSGLAVGATLRRHELPFVILEREARIAPAWHRHYERLHLHTPKERSALPFLPFPARCPRYPSRDEVAAYLEDYAHEFALHPQLGEDVLRCTRDADGWSVETDARRLRARHVVIASGLNRQPHTPRWPGDDGFPGTRLHSAAYANGAPFRGRRVLVIGFGNSAAEIALDLAEHGARPTLSVRGGVNVVPRDVLGIPVTTIALLTSRLPPHVADATNRLTIRLTIGDLAAAGLPKHADGPMVGIRERRRIPVIDVGTLARIRRGDIAVRPGVASFDGDEVRFADGRRERFDAVVLATGFTTGLASLLAAHPHVLDADGRPRAMGRESAERGLYFCGFDVVPTGALRQIGIEAVAIGDAIAAAAQAPSSLDAAWARDER